MLSLQQSSKLAMPLAHPGLTGCSRAWSSRVCPGELTWQWPLSESCHVSAWLSRAQGTQAGQFQPWAPGAPFGEEKGHGCHSAGVSAKLVVGVGPPGPRGRI